MLRPGEDHIITTDPEFVRALLAASGPDADMPVVRRQVYTFHPRIADRWRQGRVLLAGDAAHLSSPFAGLGHEQRAAGRAQLRVGAGGNRLGRQQADVAAGQRSGPGRNAPSPSYSAC